MSHQKRPTTPEGIKAAQLEGHRELTEAKGLIAFLRCLHRWREYFLICPLPAQIGSGDGSTKTVFTASVIPQAPDGGPLIVDGVLIGFEKPVTIPEILVDNPRSLDIAFRFLEAFEIRTVKESELLQK